MSMKYSNDTIGNRTRDLLACSVLPQPIAQPRTSFFLGGGGNETGPDMTAQYVR